MSFRIPSRPESRGRGFVEEGAWSRCFKHRQVRTRGAFLVEGTLQQVFGGWNGRGACPVAKRGGTTSERMMTEEAGLLLGPPWPPCLHPAPSQRGPERSFGITTRVIFLNRSRCFQGLLLPSEYRSSPWSFPHGRGPFWCPPPALPHSSPCFPLGSHGSLLPSIRPCVRVPAAST